MSETNKGAFKYNVILLGSWVSGEMWKFVTMGEAQKCDLTIKK